MATEMIYLMDTYLSEIDSIVKHVGTDEKGNYVELKSTIFYPQGGGQPADNGMLVTKDTVLHVFDVRFINESVRHYVESKEVLLEPGQNINLRVDRKTRMYNSKGHTAGHLLQAIVEKMHIGLRAIKGHHFPDGAYVQFSGKKPHDIAEFIREVNDRLKDAINEGQITEARMVSSAEAANICPDLPYSIPEDKPLRVVKIGEIGEYVPCGGTHLANVNELEQVVVTKVKTRKGDTKASYMFS